MEAALVQAVIGIVGELLAADQRDEAEALLGRMRTQFEGIQLPNLEEIEAQQLGDTALADIKADPTLEAAQYDSLGQLGDISETGLADADRAAMNRMANMTARRQKAGMAGIQQSMAQRGLAGSGLEYGARMQEAQDSNQRLSEEGQNVAGDAAQRRMNAILARGDMSGRMRGQQYNEKSEAAKARDAIARFNAASRDSASRYNQGQRQQRFANQMQKTGAIANPTNALAGFKAQSANDTRQFYGNMGAAAGEGVDSAVNNWGSGNKYTGESSEDRKKREEDDMWNNR
jgi:hypothetical protein